MYKRARISSQSWKRAIRDEFKDISSRTKRIFTRISQNLQDLNKSKDDSDRVAQMVIEVNGLKLKDNKQTEYLLFLSLNAMEKLCDYLVEPEVWDK